MAVPIQWNRRQVFQVFNLQIRICLSDRTQRGVLTPVGMPRKEGHVIRQLAEPLGERVVHLIGISTRQVDATTPLQESGVAGKE